VKTAELLLHPVRLRIIGAFLGDRKLTTADLRAEFPDVPPTSLYRHIGHLIDAGVLDVVAERRVRAAVERTYVLRAAPPVSADDLASWTPNDHRRACLAWIVPPPRHIPGGGRQGRTFPKRVPAGNTSS